MVSPFCKDLSAHWYLTTRLYDTPEFRWTPQMSNMVIKWVCVVVLERVSLSRRPMFKRRCIKLFRVYHIFMVKVSHMVICMLWVTSLSWLSEFFWKANIVSPWPSKQCNLLVVEPPNAVNCFDRDILLTDFGLSVYFEATSNQQGSSRGGIFLAPEQRDPERYGLDPEVGDRPNVRTDIFSLGPLCIQVCVERPEFCYFDTHQVLIAIHHQDPLVRRTLSDSLSDRCCGL